MSVPLCIVDTMNRRGHDECCDIHWRVWIIDPDPARPELTVFELRDGHYGLEAKTTQTITLERPFPVTIALASLTRGLRR